MLYACESFATIEDLTAVVCEGDLDEVGDEEIQAALDAGADELVRLSGFRFYGRCERTERPCTESCWGYACCCCRLDSIRLEQPVLTIDSVKIDGVTLDPSEYALFDDGTGPALVRVSTDGTRPPQWPGCQRLDRAATEDLTFEIVYTVGVEGSLVEKNANIEIALGILAAEPGRSINLVPGATTFSGGGVVFTIDTSDEAQTVSAPSVRRFLARWNPYGQMMASMAYSPELDRR